MEEGVGDGRKEKIFLRQIFVISIEPHREKKQREIFRNVDGGHRFQAWPHIFSTYDGVSASCAGATNFSLSLSLFLSSDACICTLCVCTLLTSAFLTFSFSYKAPIRGHLRAACTDLLLLSPPSPLSSSFLLSLSLPFTRCRAAFRIRDFSLVSSNYIYIYCISIFRGEKQMTNHHRREFRKEKTRVFLKRKSILLRD